MKTKQEVVKPNKEYEVYAVVNNVTEEIVNKRTGGMAIYTNLASAEKFQRFIKNNGHYKMADTSVAVMQAVGWVLPIED